MLSGTFRIPRMLFAYTSWSNSGTLTPHWSMRGCDTQKQHKSREHQTPLKYGHYKKTKEDMREQVRGILAEYMPLEDQEDGTSPMDFARRGGTQSLIG